VLFSFYYTVPSLLICTSYIIPLLKQIVNTTDKKRNTPQKPEKNLILRGNPVLIKTEL